MHTQKPDHVKTQELLYTECGNQWIAKWSYLKTLQNSEKESLITLCQLTDASIFSKPIERQKVSCAWNYFSS